MLKINSYNYIRYLAIIAHIFLTVFVLVFDQIMPKWYFSIFSASTLLLLCGFLYGVRSAALAFFSFFMYLGFFVKISVHSIFSYPFSEPIGNFSGDHSEWALFFKVSSLGVLSVVCMTYFLKMLNFKQSVVDKQKHLLVSDSFFCKYHKSLFSFLMLAIVFVTYINMRLGINLSGIAAMTVLPWPMNALIGFSHYMGFAVAISMYSLHEFAYKKSITFSLILVFFEALLSSISILSRGLFLFHFIPFFICIYLYREHLSLGLKKLFLILLTGAVLFMVSGFLVTMARSNLYLDYNLNTKSYSSRNLFSYNKLSGLSNNFSSFASQISGLVVDRWIGAEGVMAVISYPDKNMSLIYDSLLRTPKVGEKDIFEYMNKSFYPISSRYVFTSLPGPVAFFYYSGSFAVVFFGIFLFVTLLLLLQKLSKVLINNMFLQFQTAFFFAISFMQFGISPRPLVISFTMLFFLLFLLRSWNFIYCFFNKNKNTMN